MTADETPFARRTRIVDASDGGARKVRTTQKDAKSIERYFLYVMDNLRILLFEPSGYEIQNDRDDDTQQNHARHRGEDGDILSGKDEIAGKTAERERDLSEKENDSAHEHKNQTKNEKTFSQRLHVISPHMILRPLRKRVSILPSSILDTELSDTRMRILWRAVPSGFFRENPAG